jgi:hypothetical protein
MIVKTYTVTNYVAMMVHSENTDVANGAVMASGRLITITFITILPNY